MIPCIKCAKSIPDDSIFCSYCGKKQEIPQQNKRSHGNGLGTVYRFNGKWKIEYTLHYYKDGDSIKRKRITKSGFNTKKDAWLYLQRINGSKVNNNVSIAQLWDLCKANVFKDKTKARIRVYELNYDRLYNFHNKKINDINFNQLQSFINTFTAHQAKDIKLVLNTIYTYALLNNYISTNLIPNLKLPKNKTTRVSDVFTEYEINKLWSIFNDSPDKYIASILIMIYTGFMPIEVLRLQPSMINFDSSTIVGCNSVKTDLRSNTPVVFPTILVPVLRYLIDNFQFDTNIYTETTQGYYQRFKRIIKELDFNSNLSPYSCRKTTGTALALAGVSPAFIAQIMRHTKYETTLKYYTKLNTAQTAQEINKLSNYQKTP